MPAAARRPRKGTAQLSNSVVSSVLGEAGSAGLHKRGGGDARKPHSLCVQTHAPLPEPRGAPKQHVRGRDWRGTYWDRSPRGDARTAVGRAWGAGGVREVRRGLATASGTRFVCGPFLGLPAVPRCEAAAVVS